MMVYDHKREKSRIIINVAEYMWSIVSTTYTTKSLSNRANNAACIGYILTSDNHHKVFISEKIGEMRIHTFD